MDSYKPRFVTMSGPRKSDKFPINLLRGWPAPDILPISHLQRAHNELLADPEVYVPALQYGPDPGPGDLRTELARWLAKMYGVAPDPSRISISGGASQNLARILQTFTEPSYTQAVWMVAPCYYLACPIFEDAGFSGRLRAVPEDAEGIDIDYLASRLQAMDSDDFPSQPVCTDLAHPANDGRCNPCQVVDPQLHGVPSGTG